MIYALLLWRSWPLGYWPGAFRPGAIRKERSLVPGRGRALASRRFGKPIHASLSRCCNWRFRLEKSAKFAARAALSMTGTVPTYKGRIVSRLSRDWAGFGDAIGPGPGGRGDLALRPAAVLVPIIMRTEPSVLFTRRTEHLPAHAGQISFPGGSVAQGDDGVVATALRETSEETGIASDFVEVAGFLDLYTTGTGFAIQPVVGFVREGFKLEPNPAEVAEIFELPLDFLLTRTNYQLHTREWRGSPRPYYELIFGPYTVWGATASMLVDLCERLEKAS
jgi:8-oxo-dGTP pyrophosphatase MutT (NUDIX family)